MDGKISASRKSWNYQMINKQMVLIDTSAWIDFLRSSEGELGDLVAEFVNFDRAYITGPVKAELLHGARGKKEKSQLKFLFLNIPCLTVKDIDWLTTGETLQKLKRKGITVPLTDALISSIAVRNDMAILTLDKHFLQLPVQCLDPYENI